MPPVIQTARWAAAQRARESERQDRLFFDPLAAALAGEEGRAALQLSEKYNPRLGIALVKAAHKGALKRVDWLHRFCR